MKTRIPAVFSLIWLIGNQHIGAADQEQRLLYETPKVLESDQDIQKDWRRLFHREMLKSSTITVYDKFGPFNHLDWIRARDVDRSTFVDDYNKQGRKAVEKFLTYGARETAMAYYHIDDKLDLAQEFFYDLIHGSIGNTVEQEVSSTSENYTAAEGQLVQNEVRNGTYKFGIRIRTHPYVYFRLRFGTSDKKPVILMETRVQYRGGENIEELIFIPLPYEWYMRISASIIPSQISNTLNDNRWKASWSLSHQVGNYPWEGAMYIGLAVDSPSDPSRTTIRTSLRFGYAMDF